MANLTITIDERTLRLARTRALAEGTSVDALPRDYLERYAGVTDASAGLIGFVRLARRSSARSGAAGRPWTREGLLDRDRLR